MVKRLQKENITPSGDTLLVKLHSVVTFTEVIFLFLVLGAITSRFNVFAAIAFFIFISIAKALLSTISGRSRITAETPKNLLINEGPDYVNLHGQINNFDEEDKVEVIVQDDADDSEGANYGTIVVGLENERNLGGLKGTMRELQENEQLTITVDDETVTFEKGESHSEETEYVETEYNGEKFKILRVTTVFPKDNIGFKNGTGVVDGENLTVEVGDIV